jgi:hypothetical protein
VLTDYPPGIGRPSASGPVPKALTVRTTIKASPYVRFSSGGWLALGFCLLVGAVTVNPLLTVASIAVLAACTRTLWRRGEPPLLVWIVGYQWLQVSTAVLYADLLGTPVERMSYTPSVSTAVWLGLIGLLALTAGIRLGLRRLGSVVVPFSAKRLSTTLSGSRLFWVHIATIAAPLLFQAVVAEAPGLAQAVLALTFALRWGTFFLLAYTVLSTRRWRGYLLAATGIELAISTLGFFAEFKYVFLILALALAATRPLNLATVIKFAALSVAVFCFGVVWSAVKTDYRHFVSGGTGAQVVTVPITERASKLVDLTLNLDEARLRDGVDSLARRVGYVDFFAMTLDRVPRLLPYAGGAVWWGAVKHVLTPRLLFPDKPALQENVLTAKYAGIEYNFEAGGYTSISLGYMTDAYIDFGVPGMFVLIFGLGVLWGAMYRFFLLRAPVPVFGFALAAAVLVNAAFFETDSTKLLGGVLTSFLVMALVARFVLPLVLPWLTVRGRTRIPIRRVAAVGEGQVP